MMTNNFWVLISVSFNIYKEIAEKCGRICLFQKDIPRMKKPIP
jgi:hypothetical protein